LSTWAWERVDPDFSGSSGDLAKIFRHEPIKYPGVLAANAPSGDASILAREVIQNSWDAARSRRRTTDEDDISDFEIEFQFNQHIDAEREVLVEAFGLTELAERAAKLGPFQLGLGDATRLPRIQAGGPVKTLQIAESGTTGMDGPWRGNESKLFLALVSLGFTQKESGAGGAYGYGKAGLIRGSAIRTLLAYTCFREREDDSGVTRRLLAMTYWGPHQIDDMAFTGFARSGAGRQGSKIKPYENGSADRLARRLGLDVRNPDDPEQLGTTFLLVEPTVAPDDLARAIECNWWPALMDPTFGTKVIDYDGRPIHPRPKSDPVLRSFMRAHEVAVVPQDNSVATEKKTALHRWKSSSGEYKLGAVGFVADPTDWSYPATEADIDDGEADHQRSLVALVRSPQMVVQYLDVGGAAPVVRGVFVADDDIDDLLRQTEPKAHNSWDTEAGADGVHPDAPGAAKAVLERVKRSAADFRKALRPPTPDKRELRLPDLENLFSEVFAGSSQTDRFTATASQYPVEINVVNQRPELCPEDPDRIRLSAQVTYRLADHVESETEEALIRLRYKFVEDGRSGAECALKIVPPTGFEAVEGLPGAFRGPLRKQAMTFEVISGPYHPDWTGRLVAAGDLEQNAGATQ
jgi:hypothetical protein